MSDMFLDTLVILGAIVTFFFSFMIGGNDIGSSLGTAVGSGSIRLKYAVVIGCVMEFSGLVFFGGSMFPTIRTGIVGSSCFEDNWSVLALGFFAAAVGALVWKTVATFKVWPVSGAHSIVSGILGFGYIMAQSCVNQDKVMSLAVSWVLSPVLGGLGGYALFSCVDFLLLKKKNPFASTLKAMPLIWSFTVGASLVLPVNTILTYTPLNDVDNALIMTIAALMVVTFIVVQCVYVRSQRKQLNKLNSQYDDAVNTEQRFHELLVAAKTSPVTLNVAPESSDVAQVINTLEQVMVKSSELSEQLFAPLLIITAAMLAFSHGANNSANCVGPFDSIMIIQSSRDTPLWVLMLGGVGVVMGIALVGYLAMDAIGRKITAITCSRGFAAQLASTLVVMTATFLGLPVSTSHVVIGAVTGVGIAVNAKNLNTTMLLRILSSWGITIPFSIIVTMSFYLWLDRFAEGC